MSFAAGSGFLYTREDPSSGSREKEKAVNSERKMDGRTDGRTDRDGWMVEIDDR